MIERLTYITGIAAAVLAWLVAQLVGDLSNVAILYHKVETGSAAEATEARRTTFEVRNLSRTKAISNLQLRLGTKPGCSIDDGKVYAAGLEWYGKAAAASGGIISVTSLMPGSALRIGVESKAECAVDMTFEFNANVAGAGQRDVIRLASPGTETFLLRNWLAIILGMLFASAGCFATAFIYAYWTSRSNDKLAVAKARADLLKTSAETEKLLAETHTIRGRTQSAVGY